MIIWDAASVDIITSHSELYYVTLRGASDNIGTFYDPVKLANLLHIHYIISIICIVFALVMFISHIHFLLDEKEAVVIEIDEIDRIWKKHIKAHYVITSIPFILDSIMAILLLSYLARGGIFKYDTDLSFGFCLSDDLGVEFAWGFNLCGLEIYLTIWGAYFMSFLSAILMPIILKRIQKYKMVKKLYPTSRFHRREKTKNPYKYYR